MQKSGVFDFKHYRDYLKVRLTTSGPNRGLRAKLAAKMGTVPSFISRVLAGDLDLSPEHIPPVNQLLQHTAEESHYFTLLVLEARAGTKDLENYYLDQMRELKEKRNVFLERVKVSEKVSNADQAKYYSHWHFSVIHMLVALPAYASREAISKRLDLPLAAVSSALEELIGMGLVENKGGRYGIGKKRIHLEKNSPWIAQLHSHYRQRALYRLAAPEKSDLHFTLAMGVSKEFIEEYRKRILDLVTEFESKMLAAKEEEVYALNIDLFRF